MIAEIRKMTNEQWFLLVALSLTILLSFLGGYVVFRYSQIEMCKSPVEVGDFSEVP